MFNLIADLYLQIMHQYYGACFKVEILWSWILCLTVFFLSLQCEPFIGKAAQVSRPCWQNTSFSFPGTWACWRLVYVCLGRYVDSNRHWLGWKAQMKHHKNMVSFILFLPSECIAGNNMYFGVVFLAWFSACLFGFFQLRKIAFVKCRYILKNHNKMKENNNNYKD